MNTKPYIQYLMAGAIALFGMVGLHAQNNSTVAGSSRSSLYIAPTVGICIPGDDFDAGFGGGVAFGTVLKDVHYIEAEISYYKFDMKDFYLGGYRASGDVGYMPILLNYRYNIPLGQSRFALQFGGSVGAVMEKAKASSRVYSFSETDWAFAAGAQANAVYNFTESTSANVGVRALWTSDTDALTDGTTLFFNVGVAFRF